MRPAFLLQHPVQGADFLKKRRSRLNPELAHAIAALLVVENIGELSRLSAARRRIHRFVQTCITAFNSNEAVVPQLGDKHLVTSFGDLVLCAWFPTGIRDAVRGSREVAQFIHSTSLPASVAIRFALGRHEYAAFCLARFAEGVESVIDEKLWSQLDELNFELKEVGLLPPDVDRIREELTVDDGFQLPESVEAWVRQ